MNDISYGLLAIISIIIILALSGNSVQNQISRKLKEDEKNRKDTEKLLKQLRNEKNREEIEKLLLRLHDEENKKEVEELLQLLKEEIKKKESEDNIAPKTEKKSQDKESNL